VIEFARFASSLVPVFVFLGALVFLDSYKLVSLRSVLIAILAGAGAAVAGMFVNIVLLDLLSMDYFHYSRFIAPFIEEVLKAIYIIYLFRARRVGFMVDAAIYGFAVGAGFAFIENLYFLHSIESQNILLWIVRGFGTAVMHGGTTAIFAIISKSLSSRHNTQKLYIFLPGLAAAIGIHAFFNVVIRSPMLTTVVQIVALPVLVFIAFARSEKNLRDWLEIGLDTDVLLLNIIQSGDVPHTNIGKYLDSLRDRFPGEVVADMLCYLRVSLELAALAKGMLLMKEAGFSPVCDEETLERLAELKYLEKSIGKTGRLAISPLIHTTARELWQLCMLGKK
jgi:RsiW-degrading membrane proteinase PrsW (M82 family)